MTHFSNFNSCSHTGQSCSDHSELHKQTPWFQKNNYLKDDTRLKRMFF